MLLPIFVSPKKRVIGIEKEALWINTLRKKKNGFELISKLSLVGVIPFPSRKVSNFFPSIERIVFMIQCMKK